MRVQIFDGLPASRGSVVGTGMTNANWKELRNRKDGHGSKDTYYVRAHLLNNNIGGSGTDWDNLSILTRTANNRDWYEDGSHETKIEVRAKNLVKDGKSFIYIVTANYGRSKNQALLNQIPTDLTLSVSEKDTLTKIVEAEEFVPTGFVCTITELDPSDGSENQSSNYNINEIVVNPIENNNISDYSL